MRSLLMLLLFSSLVVLQTNTTNALHDSKEEKMNKLIEDIIGEWLFLKTNPYEFLCILDQIG